MMVQDSFSSFADDEDQQPSSGVADFYEYVTKRQQVYVRKEVEGNPPPWTSDPVLREHHFCNIRREWDAGTRFYLQEVVPGAADGPDEACAEDLFIRTVVYRVLNRPESYEEIEHYLNGAESDIEGIVETLREKQAQGKTIFSSAYRLGGPNHTEYDDKLGQLLYGGIRDDLMPRFQKICHDTMFADNFEKANQPLRDVRGLGEFFAYEVTTDLNYVWFDFDADDFVNVGPGAEDGLERIYSDHIGDYEAMLRELQSEQGRFLPDDFPFMDADPYLTARDIEHSLCEYSKFVRVRNGNGQTRKYKPE